MSAGRALRLPIGVIYAQELAMKLTDIMSTPVHIIAGEATVLDAARTMDQLNVGVLPVCEHDNVVGIITDRDVVVRCMSAGLDPRATRVHDIMTTPITYVFADQSVEHAARMMKAGLIRRLPVLDRSHRLVGIVSVDDLVREPLVGAGVVEAIAQVERPNR
jgi:CBS domain-containing protein